MGIFSFLNNLSGSRPNNTTPVKTDNLDIILKNSDKEIAECQAADRVFEEDGDLSKRIAVYERYFLRKPQWNAFNFCLSLATMYVKNNDNNKAWGYLNQLFIWTTESGPIYGYAYKVRYEQFKILKSEKKYKDALILLTSSCVLRSEGCTEPYFNKTKFIKDANTTSKGIGFPAGALEKFADRLEDAIKAKALKDSVVTQFCTDYFNEVLKS